MPPVCRSSLAKVVGLEIIRCFCLAVLVGIVVDFVDDLERICACIVVNVGSTCGTEGGVIMEVEGIGGRLRGRH